MQKKMQKKTQSCYVALENLRSLHNIGAIFRTCSFFGVTNVLLVGYSGKAFDHTGQVILHDHIKKTALGAETDITIHFLADARALLKFAAQKKLAICCIEQTPTSKPLTTLTQSQNVIFVFGNEVTGVSAEVLNGADAVYEITKVGTHNSLNVTTAVGIVLWKYVER